MIVFKNVDKVYPNGFKALTDINLQINDGDFVSIIGLSGAGKSTLLRTINKMHDIQNGELYVDVFKTIKSSEKCIKKEIERKMKAISKLNPEIEADEVAIIKKEVDYLEDILKKGEFDGSSIQLKQKINVRTCKGKELRLLRRNIGMIFQSFNLVKRSNVYKNVLSGRVGYHNFFESVFGIYKKEEKMLALQCLDKLGILDKAYVRADELSGGQMQRVALSRALTQEPNIILADEPVASLDPITTMSVMNDFKRINQEFGITIVANMHHVDLALKYSTRIIGIKEGKIVFDGKPEDVNDDVIKQIYGRSLKSNEKLGEHHVQENE